MLSVDRSQPRHYGDAHQRYFSVSQVCRVLMGEQQYSPLAAQLGTDIHAIFALSLYARDGKCEQPVIEPAYQGYHKAIQEWIAKYNPRPIHIETPMTHPCLPYAGTPDFVGLVGGHYGVLDLKTGEEAAWHRVQIQAYGKMLTEKHPRLWLLYIRPTGEYKQYIIRPSARDWAAFQNALSILQWRESI